MVLMGPFVPKEYKEKFKASVVVFFAPIGQNTCVWCKQLQYVL